MHNGTVYRWNRPVYDCSDGKPHLRIENRVLPAGPTVVDIMANAAFYYGTVRALVNAERPLWSHMSFHAAEENLHIGAKYGLDATLYWPEIGWVGADELVLRRLLPLADEGLADFGLSAAARDRYLGVIEGRCMNRQTGAAWQREQVAHAEGLGRGPLDCAHRNAPRLRGEHADGRSCSHLVLIALLILLSVNSFGDLSPRNEEGATPKKPDKWDG